MHYSTLLQEGTLNHFLNYKNNCAGHCSKLCAKLHKPLGKQTIANFKQVSDQNLSLQCSSALQAWLVSNVTIIFKNVFKTTTGKDHFFQLFYKPQLERPQLKNTAALQNAI